MRVAPKSSLIGNPMIKSQVTNTAAGFTLVALTSTIVFLLANAIAVFMTASNFPKPNIKTIAIKGLEENTARVYLDVEFPGSRTGNLISAQTEGPLKVSLFVSENGKDLPADPSLFVEIPNGINLNLASKTASRLNSISDLISAKIQKLPLKKEQLPNVQIKVETRVVFKSLWIPIGISVNYPHNLDLSKLLEEPKKTEKTNEPQTKKPQDQKTLTEEGKNLSEFELKKKKIISDFNFMPRSVKVLASDDKIFEITAVAALPAIMIPEYLTVEVPTITLRANFFEVGNGKDDKYGEVMSMVEVRVDPFLIQTAPEDDLTKEVQFRVSLLIEEKDVKGLTRILELVRDEKMENIGIQIQPGSNKKTSGLMYWLKDFVVDIPVKALAKSDAEKKKEEEAKKQKEDAKKKEEGTKQKPEESTQEAEQVASAPSATGTNQIVSFKFLKTEKVPGLQFGGSFTFQIKVSRSSAGFLVGKLPELNFEVEMVSQASPDVDRTAQLLGLNVSPKEIVETDEALEINLKFTIGNLRDLVFTGMRMSKMGSKAYHELQPDVKAIKALRIKSKSNNIISKLAAIFDVEALITDNGLEKVRFQNSERVLFPKPKEKTKEGEAKEKDPDVKPDKPAETGKKQMELRNKFTINNAVDKLNKKIVNIGALIEMDQIPYFGDYVHASWESFTLKLKSEDDLTIFQFQISKGVLNLGITGGAKPILINFSTGIIIPSEQADLVRLQTFLKNFLELERKLIDIKLEMYSGSDYSEEGNSFNMDATIPCKKLLQPEVKEDSADVKDTKDADAKESKDTEVEKVKPVVPPVENPKRNDFIGQIQNSILSFVSFQASTLLLHVTYPDGQYCPVIDSFDLKLKIDISLPMIEANLCSKPRIDHDLACFVSAGISRPMKFSIDIIDGNICHVESAVLPQETGIELAGFSTIQDSTNIQFEHNEIPLHISIRDFTKLVLFVEWAAAKKRQFITVGPVEGGTSFNNLIGSLVSAVFSKEIPEPNSENKAIETAAVAGDAEKAVETPKNVPKKFISFNTNDPAVLKFQGYSTNENNLEILLGFDLPSNAFQGIRIAKKKENRFEWPVVRWGMFDYTVGVEDVFSLSLSMTRGQIDVQDDLTGIVPSLLQEFGLRIKLTTNEEYKLGSTALRQVFGTFKSYFLNPTKDKSQLLEKYFKGHLEKKFNYKFIMNGPRGVDDKDVFFAKGMVPLRDLVVVGDAIFNRPKHPDDPEVERVVIKAPTEEKPANEDNKKESEEDDLLEKAKITIRTISKDELSQVEFPCLIPALCGNPGQSSGVSKRVQENPFDMVFEVENILQPVTQLIAKKIGPVFEKFKMAHYPSHFRIKFIADTDVWISLMLNGAGIVSVGLKPFEFDRTAFITYSPETTVDFIPPSVDSSILNSNGRDPVIDKFEIKLSIKFPNTISGLRSTLGILRRESMLMPPIAPVSVRAKEDDPKLVNPPVVIALSSDDPYESTRGKNLFSALIAAMIPEKVLPGINLSDQMLAEYFDKSLTAGNEKEKVNEQPKTSADGGNQQETEMGSLDLSKAGMIGYCLLVQNKIVWTNACETQLDLNYNVKMPFAVKLLKLILPSTSIVRLYVEDAPVIQVVADSKKNNRLQVSYENGLDILGTVNVCFNGLKQVSKETVKNIASYFWGNEPTKVKLQVILGHDVDISANLFFPFYTAKSIIYQKVKDSLYNAVPLAASLISRFFPAPGTAKFPDEATEFFRNSRPERRVCLDNIIDQKGKDERLKDIEYEKTVLFFEHDKDGVKPGKPFNAHLQLRSAKDLVVCGVPEGLGDKITGKFVYDQGYSFIKLMDLISYTKPPKSYIVPFTANFDRSSNLFTMKGVNLEHTGRYTVEIVTPSRKTVTIADTVVYVTHEY